MATTTTDLPALHPQQDPSRARRAWVLVALVTFLVVLAAEAGARVLAPHLPQPDDWNQREAAQTYDQMRGLSAAGGVDTVLLGSSVAAFGFEPDTYTEVTGKTAYNAALPGSGMESIEAWTRDFVVPLLKPKRAIIALTSRDLNDNGPVQREHLQAYMTSEARRRALGLTTSAERIERFATDHSALVRLRRYLRQPAAIAKQFRGEDALVRQVALGAHGEARFPEADYPFSEDPQRVAWEREALQNFAMSESIASLARLIAYLRARDIDVVLVDMPVVASTYMPYHPRGRADFDAYRGALERSGAPVVTIDTDTWDVPANFVDVIHLNRAGARAFTRALATRLNQG